MPSFGFFEPILIFTLLNVTMALGLYITALSVEANGSNETITS